jgi:hypothetical protein
MNWYFMGWLLAPTLAQDGLAVSRNSSRKQTKSLISNKKDGLGRPFFTSRAPARPAYSE